MESGKRNRQRYALGARLCFACLAVFFVVNASRADNIRAGPFSFSFGLNPGFEWTDNVNNSETDKVSDFSLNFGPTIDIGFAEGGTLKAFGAEMSLSMSINYDVSVTGNSENTFDAPINFSLTIPFYLSKWMITVNDTFTFSNDPLESTFATNREQVPQYNNTASVTGTRQFGKFELSLAAQMLNDFYPDDPNMEQNQFSVSATPSYMLRPGYSVFWQNVLGYTLQNAPKQNIVGFTTGLGVSGQITENLSGSVSIGYAWSFLQERNLGPGDGIFGGIFDPVILPRYNLGGINATVALNYASKLRPNTTYTIAFFQDPGVSALLEDSSIQSTIGVNLGLSHQLSRGITLSPTISWQHIEDAGPQDIQTGPRERTDVFQVRISFGRQLTRKLSSSLSYEFQQRSSNLPGESYQVNTITGSLNYTF